MRSFLQAASAIRVGNGMDPTTEMGPVISEGQMKRVLGYVQSGIDEGAHLSLGGRRLVDGDYGKGYFVQPTVFEEVERRMKIFREEIFGPVLCVIPFRDEDDAISIANDTSFGLAGDIWSRNLTRIL